MIGYLTLILACQLVGESVATLTGMPIPGPVLGMLVLFVYLAVRGHVPEDLATTGTGLLRNMSLLFVPAGAGVILHFRLLADSLLPLAVAVAVSTSATIVVTALMMRWLGRAERSDG